jgi:alpha-D-xyloside xylohydrolase
MDFPNDPNVADIGTQYMFGPAFLVAPVTEQGQTEKNVYLPAGTDWYNFWTDEKLAGGQWVKVAAPIDRIPVFVKAGSIVPFGTDIQSTATKQGIAQVKVYPGRDGSFDLYDDDGVSYDYEKGKGTTTRLQWNDGAGKLTASGGDANVAKNLPSITKVAGK